MTSQQPFYQHYCDHFPEKDLQVFIAALIEWLDKKGVPRNEIRNNIANVFFGGEIKYADEFMVYLAVEK